MVALFFLCARVLALKRKVPAARFFIARSSACENDRKIERGRRNERRARARDAAKTRNPETKVWRNLARRTQTRNRVKAEGRDRKKKKRKGL